MSSGSIIGCDFEPKPMDESLVNEMVWNSIESIPWHMSNANPNHSQVFPSESACKPGLEEIWYIMKTQLEIKPSFPSQSMRSTLGDRKADEAKSYTFKTTFDPKSQRLDVKCRIDWERHALKPDSWSILHDIRSTVLSGSSFLPQDHSNVE